METGLAIFVVGLIFAVIYLYSITKDRWDWLKITYLSSIPFVLLLTLTFYIVFKLLYLDSIYIKLLLLTSFITIVFLLNKFKKQKWNFKKIFQKYKKIGILLTLIFISYLSYGHLKNYYDLYKNEVALKREEKARECNAREIKRLEPILEKSFKSLDINSSYDDAKNSLDGIKKQFLSDKSAVIAFKNSISPENIKVKTLELILLPNCDTAFYYQIKIEAGEDNKLLKYDTLATNMPVGYNPNIADISDLPVPPKKEAIFWERDSKDTNLEVIKLDTVYLLKYSANYQEQRKIKAEEASRAFYNEYWAKKLNKEKEEKEFKIRKAAEEAISEKTKVMNQLSINKNIQCSHNSSFDEVGECTYGYNMSVTVKNNSDKKITLIAFGWDLYAKPNECIQRGKYTPKQTFSSESYFDNQKPLVMPGETKNFSFSETLPRDYRNRNPNSICLDIADIKYSTIK